MLGDVIATQLATNQLAAASAVICLRPCATFGIVRRLIAHRVCTRERRNASQRIARGLLNMLQTTQGCCPFTAAENAVKVYTFILDAYMRNWHLRTCNYLTHICIMYKL